MALSSGNAAEATLSKDGPAPAWAEGAALLCPATMIVRKYTQVKPCLSFRDVAKPRLIMRKKSFSSPRYAKQVQC